MGKYLDIVRKLENQKNESPGSHVENREPVTFEPVKGGMVCADLLTDLEREIYEDVIEVAQSKFGHDKKTAEGVAGRYVQEKCRPLQAEQAAKDFKQYGYVQIFSAVLGGRVYLVKHKGVAGRVPDRSLPVYMPEDIEAVKGLSPKETLALLEALMIFGGSITKNTN